MALEIGDILDDSLAGYFDFEDGVELKIGYLSTETASRLIKQATKTKWKKGQQIEKIDDMKLQRLIGEECLLGWRGLEEKGKELPFTPENRDRVMTKFAAIGEFVSEKSKEHQELIDKQREKNVKNS